MASSIKETVQQTGQGLADAARNVGHKIAEGANKAVDFAKEHTGWGAAATGDIKEHMQVIASCGTPVGKVDRVEGNAIKLTKNDSPDGRHHFIPMNWVERVDTAVHLKKNSEEAERDWKADAASCGCGA